MRALLTNHHTVRTGVVRQHCNLTAAWITMPCPCLYTRLVYLGCILHLHTNIHAYLASEMTVVRRAVKKQGYCSWSNCGTKPHLDFYWCRYSTDCASSVAACKLCTGKCSTGTSCWLDYYFTWLACIGCTLGLLWFTQGHCHT